MPYGSITAPITRAPQCGMQGAPIDILYVLERDGNPGTNGLRTLTMVSPNTDNILTSIENPARSATWMNSSSLTQN